MLEARRRWLVDRRIQRPFMMRAVYYWLASIGTALCLVLAWRAFSASGLAAEYSTHTWFYCAPMLIAAVLLLPLVCLDSVVLSNRLVGPMLRLRHAMRSLALGEPVEQLCFRRDDFWQEFAAEFNIVARQVDDLRREVEELRVGKAHEISA